jgi:hypothetical protein
MTWTKVYASAMLNRPLFGNRSNHRLRSCQNPGWQAVRNLSEALHGRAPSARTRCLSQVHSGTDAQKPIPKNCAHLSPRRTGEIGRPKSHQLSKSSWGESWTTDAAPRVPNEFRPTGGEFCPTPWAKLSQFRPTATFQMAIFKRLAASGWGETRRVSPHEKKEKNFAGAKPQNPFAARTCRCRWPATEFAVDLSRSGF